MCRLLSWWWWTLTITTETILILILNDLAILAAFFIASAAKQGKLSLVRDVTEALSQFSPGVAAAEFAKATITALRKSDLPKEKETGEVEEEEIPIMGSHLEPPGQ